MNDGSTFCENMWEIFHMFAVTLLKEVFVFP